MFSAAKYAAITHYYYYGQHCLLEPIAEVDPTAAPNPANNGKLVQVQGRMRAENVLRDPLYGIEMRAVSLERRISPISRVEGNDITWAPPSPDEPYLKEWMQYADVSIGSYKLEGLKSALPSPFHTVRTIATVMDIDQELRPLAEVDSQGLIMPSANGFKYKVSFISGLEKEGAFIGRQQGDALVAGEQEVWRMKFVARLGKATPAKALMNACFFLLLAWGAAMLVIHTVSKATRGSLKLRALTLSALFLALLTMLSVYSSMIDLGVLWTDPTFDHPWRATTRVFIPHCFEAGREQAAQWWLNAAMLLCIALPLLYAGIALLRRRAAKKA